MFRICFLCVCVIIFCRISVYAAFDYTPVHPGALFPFVCAAQSYYSPSCENPASAPLNQKSCVYAAGERPYSMDDLHSGILGCCFYGENYSLTCNWKTFGTEGYREESYNAGAGIRFSEIFNAGASCSWNRLHIDCEGYELDRSAKSYSAGIIIKPFNGFRAAFLHRNIDSRFRDSNRDMLYPEYSYGISVDLVKGVPLCLNRTHTAFGPVDSASVSVPLKSWFCVSTGYSPETKTTAVSFTLALSGFLMSYGLRTHPYLGCTHSIGVTLYAGSFSFPKITWARPGYDKNISPRDINTVSEAELASLPGMNSDLARRIVILRKMQGRLYRDDLTRMGMSPSQVKAFMPFVYGFKEKKKKKTHSRRSYRSEKARPSVGLFKSLVSCGVGSRSALDICTLHGKGQKKALKDYISDMDLAESKKQKVRALCGI